MDETKNTVEIKLNEDLAIEPFYDIEELSLYDPSFSMKLLSGALNRKKEQASQIIKAVYDSVIRESSLLAQSEQAMNKGFRYVVDVTESTLEAIESGKLSLLQKRMDKHLLKFVNQMDNMVLNFQ